MSEQQGQESATGEGQQEQQETEQLGDAGKRALERMKTERDEARRTAKANADAAKELETLKQEKMTETEKVAARLQEADAKVAGIPGQVAEGLKAHLVALHKIDTEDADLFLTAADPETLLKQVDRLLAQGKKGEQQTRRNGNFVPREGSQSSAPEGEARAAVRGLFGT
jgi:hypothetical protein